MTRLSERQKKKEQQVADETKIKFYNSIIEKFKNGLLTREELKKIPYEKSNKYLHQELEKKYPKHKINFSCYHCACSVVFTSIILFLKNKSAPLGGCNDNNLAILNSIFLFVK